MSAAMTQSSELQRSVEKFHYRITVLLNAAGKAITKVFISCGYGIGHLCRAIASFFELVATTADHVSHKYEMRHIRKSEDVCLSK